MRRPPLQVFPVASFVDLRVMKLTAKPRDGMGIRSSARAATAEPGARNANRQVVMARTGAPSTTRERQVIYKLRCADCGYEYGCNGMDIKARRCPQCQGGVAGEPLREPPQAGLFG